MGLFDKKPKQPDQKQTLNALKKAFDSQNWKYNVDEENNVVNIGMMGDDLPIHAMVFVEKLTVRFVGVLDFSVPQEKYRDMAYELNKINDCLKFGKFSLNEESGRIVFGYCFIIGNECPSQELLLAVFNMAIETVDEHDGDLSKIVQDVGGKRTSSNDSMYQ